MRIRFSPQRRTDEMLTDEKPKGFLSVAGDVLFIDGEAFDIAAMADSDALAPTGSAWLVNASREGAEMIATVLLPHGPNPAENVAFPLDIIDAPDGPLGFP